MGRIPWLHEGNVRDEIRVGRCVPLPFGDHGLGASDAAFVGHDPKAAGNEGRHGRRHEGRHDLRSHIRQLDGLPMSLDGVLCANVLHFVPDPKPVLVELANRLVPGGRVVLIEYDRDQGSRWVPHPIPRRQLDALFEGTGFETPEVVGMHASRFGGKLYVTVARVASGA